MTLAEHMRLADDGCPNCGDTLIRPRYEVSYSLADLPKYPVGGYVETPSFSVTYWYIDRGATG